MSFMVGFGIITLFDSLTLKEVGTERVPCIDKHGNPFEDEFCEDTIYCSKLGFAGDKKCSELRDMKEQKINQGDKVE